MFWRHFGGQLDLDPRKTLVSSVEGSITRFLVVSKLHDQSLGLLIEEYSVTSELMS